MKQNPWLCMKGCDYIRKTLQNFNLCPLLKKRAFYIKRVVKECIFICLKMFTHTCIILYTPPFQWPFSINRPTRNLCYIMKFRWRGGKWREQKDVSSPTLSPRETSGADRSQSPVFRRSTCTWHRMTQWGCWPFTHLCTEQDLVLVPRGPSLV